MAKHLSGIDGLGSKVDRSASIIAVTSGKGGVGKTHISANLAILLAKQGKRICIIDADHGLANINLILGLRAHNQPHDLFAENFDLPSAMIKTDSGVDILPATSGISQETTNLPPSGEQIKQMLERLRPLYDMIIVDTAAGLGQDVSNYLAAADHALLIITTEPTSLTDGFGLVRKMKKVQPRYRVVINRVANAKVATSVYRRFAGAIKKYVGAPTQALGFILEDSFVSAAVLSQTAVVEYSPCCPASRCLQKISLSVSKHLASPVKEQSTQIKPTESTESAIPSVPSFLRSAKQSDPFDDWLVQINSFFATNDITPEVKQQRSKKLRAKIESLCQLNDSIRVDFEKGIEFQEETVHIEIKDTTAGIVSSVDVIERSAEIAVMNQNYQKKA